MKDLITVLREIPDRRQAAKVLHRLDEMLFVVICAVISGCDGWSDIVEFAHSKESWLKRFVQLEHGIPVDDTIARIMAWVSPKAFEQCLMRLSQQLAEACDEEVIAVDGKRIRRSYDRKQGQAPLHMVRAWATAQGMALGMVKTDCKSNEITAIPELLALLELKGAIVTLDAMGCQSAIAEQIVEQEADYVLAVKDNQPALHGELQEFFTTAQAHQFQDVPHTFSESIDSGHGRIETRRCWASECLVTLSNPERWKGLKSVVLIERERIVDGLTSNERAYYITSLPANAARIAAAVRAHWAIENSCHWVIDVTFNEDRSRIRKGEAPHNFALLRQFALHLLKKHPAKLSIRRKRLRAALNDSFRLQVLAAAA
jgi:predicted transposase YbfD/YdcC